MKKIKIVAIILVLFVLSNCLYSKESSRLMAYLGVRNGITKIDTYEGKVVEKIWQVPLKEFRWVHEIEMIPSDRRLYVVSRPSGREDQILLVVDTRNFRVSEEIDLCPPEARNKAFGIDGLKLLPNGKKLYVSVSYSGEKREM